MRKNVISALPFIQHGCRTGGTHEKPEEPNEQLRAAGDEDHEKLLFLVRKKTIGSWGAPEDLIRHTRKGLITDQRLPAYLEHEYRLRINVEP